MECQIFKLFGLPDTSVKESKERVKAAIRNSNIEFLSRRIIVNLSPASTRKEGSMFDLSIAIGVLIANRNIRNLHLGKLLMETIFIGELSLNGNIEKTKGILPIAMEAKRLGIKRMIIPMKNAEEVQMIEGIEILPVKSLREVMDYLNGEKEITPKDNHNISLSQDFKYEIDFSEVKGQKSVKRALEIAASGGHNCILIGSPRSGKNHVSKKNANHFARNKLRRSYGNY